MLHCDTCTCEHSATLINLRMACESGILVMRLDTALKARQRDPYFPVGKIYGRMTLYDPADLQNWQTNRYRGAKTSHGNTRCAICRQQNKLCDKCKAIRRSAGNRRRAQRQLSSITGPISYAIYRQILFSGPCVYCGREAMEVDHIRPLSRGGWEHEINLVPACGNCNHTKSDKLLTEWNKTRVTYGRAHSPKVAAEYVRLSIIESESA
jgi:5-methylcytosine-specific restriction endonuclease McrA